MRQKAGQFHEGITVAGIPDRAQRFAGVGKTRLQPGLGLFQCIELRQPAAQNVQLAGIPLLDHPAKLRCDIGVGLLVVLAIYGIVIARYAPGVIGDWPTLVQTLIYIVLGLIWLLPLRRFLIWMETGRWG